MRITKFIQFFGLIFIFSSACIDRYYLDSEANFEGKLVIDGTITDEDGVQKIVISRSSSPEFPQFFPVLGCAVFVEDDQGNQFHFNKGSEPGHYQKEMDEANMAVGTKFRLSVTTPEGEQYLSTFEEMLACPPIESVYYGLETKGTYERGTDEDGLQFYLDFNGSENDSKFFRWKLEETYEYHSTWPITRYLDYDGFHEGGTDFSFYVCYQTENIDVVFTLSTEGFSQNSYSRYPLHFVNDHTQRLMYQYSLVVKQLSLSESAYYYWDNMRKNNQEAVDLFGKQPANAISNIRNVADSSEIVLGYFGVSSVSTRRITVLDVPDLSFSEVPYCAAIPPSEEPPPYPYEPRPLYLVLTKDANYNQVWGFAPSECFICTMKGGTTEKPVYWIDE